MSTAPKIKQDIVLDVKGLKKTRNLAKAVRSVARSLKSVEDAQKSLRKEQKASARVADKIAKETKDIARQSAAATREIKKQTVARQASTVADKAANREAKKGILLLKEGQSTINRRRRQERAAMAYANATASGLGPFIVAPGGSVQSQAQIEALQRQRANQRAGLPARGSFREFDQRAQALGGTRLPGTFQPGNLQEVAAQLRGYENAITKVNQKIGRYQRLIELGQVIDKEDLANKQKAIRVLKARRARLNDMMKPLKEEREQLIKSKAATIDVRKENRKLNRENRRLDELRKRYSATQRKSILNKIKEKQASIDLRKAILQEAAAQRGLNLAGAGGRRGRAFGRGAAHTVSGGIGALFGNLRNVATSVLFHATSGVGLGILGSIGALRVAYAGAIKPAGMYEKALALVAKTTKMSKEETRLYGDQLIELSNELGIAREKLVEVSIVAGQMGIRGRENLLEFTKTVAMMNRVSEIEVQRAADGIAALSTAFDLPIVAAERMGSVLNELGNHSIANAKKIIESLSNVSKVAKQFGLNFQETSAIVATLIHGGMPASKAGVALRSIIVDLQTRQKEITAVMNMSVEEYTNMLQEDPLGTMHKVFDKMGELDFQQRSKIFKNTFGRRYQQAVGILANEFELFSKFLGISNEAMDEGTSLAMENARAMDNMGSAWERATETFKNFFTQSGRAGADFFQQMGEGFTLMLGGIGAFETAELPRIMNQLREQTGRGFRTGLAGVRDFRSKRRLDEAREDYIRRLTQEEGSIGMLEQGIEYFRGIGDAEAVTELKAAQPFVKTDDLINVGDIEGLKTHAEDLIALQETSIELNEQGRITDRERYRDLAREARKAKDAVKSLNEERKETKDFDIEADPSLFQEYTQNAARAGRIIAAGQDNNQIAQLLRESATLESDLESFIAFRQQLPEAAMERGEASQWIADAKARLTVIDTEIDRIQELIDKSNELAAALQQSLGDIELDYSDFRQIPDKFQRDIAERLFADSADDFSPERALEYLRAYFKELGSEIPPSVAEMFQRGIELGTPDAISELEDYMRSIMPDEFESGKFLKTLQARRDAAIRLSEEEMEMIRRRDAYFEEVEEKRKEAREKEKEAIFDAAEAQADQYSEMSQIATTLLQNLSAMGNALGIMNDRGRDFVRSMINSVEAARRLLVTVEMINAARAAGKTVQPSSALGPVGAAIGLAVGVIGMVGALIGGRRRRRRQQELKESETTSVSVSRSMTEIQANAWIMLAQQQVYWLREIHRKISQGFVPANAISKNMPYNSTGSPESSTTRVKGLTPIIFDGTTIEVAANPDDRHFANASGEALTTQMKKYGIRRT